MCRSVQLLAALPCVCIPTITPAPWSVAAASARPTQAYCEGSRSLGHPAGKQLSSVALDPASVRLLHKPPNLHSAPLSEIMATRRHQPLQAVSHGYTIPVAQSMLGDC